ncbi:hypothetical protein [Paenibacillus peoriae]|uniref:hypothetical protein n=1 Tax=Paenibacillus peoriae TaxID=59893 RepID=UPI0015C40146|nr:hypothetical protein [Paenibacillus peoriae]
MAYLSLTIHTSKTYGSSTAVASGAGRIVLKKRGDRKNNLHVQRPPTDQRLQIVLT